MSERDSVLPVGDTQNGPIIWDETKVKDLLEFIELPSNSVDKKVAVKKEIQDYISSLAQQVRANEKEMNESQSSPRSDDLIEDSDSNIPRSLQEVFDRFRNREDSGQTSSFLDGLYSSAVIFRDIVIQNLVSPLIAPTIFVLLRSIVVVFDGEATNDGEIFLLVFCDPTLMAVFSSNFFYEWFFGAIFTPSDNDERRVKNAKTTALLTGISFLLMFLFLKFWNNPSPSLALGIPIIIIEFSLTTAFYDSIVYIKRRHQEVLR